MHRAHLYLCAPLKVRREALCSIAAGRICRQSSFSARLRTVCTSINTIKAFRSKSERFLVSHGYAHPLHAHPVSWSTRVLLSCCSLCERGVPSCLAVSAEPSMTAHMDDMQHAASSSWPGRRLRTTSSSIYTFQQMCGVRRLSARHQWQLVSAL